uniref:Uncharacterized protein n=1 Tax=Cajanus cajan TaxID=3821 RepID=A0A151TJ32_CAJCA|nr:hypothetical protein KK1_013322 [Cajanus cajan]
MCRYPFAAANSITGGGHRSRRQLGCGGGTANIPWAATAVRGHATEGSAEGAEAATEETGAAGTVPVPVAAMMEGSAWRRSHSMVSPSERWPSSRVSWNMRAAQSGGMRTRRPRPLTLVWRSLEERAAAEEGLLATAAEGLVSE